jgi:hypothetical protein
MLPFVVSPSLGDRQTNPVPFATTAFAGHVVGSYAPCVCGSRSDCICDPGETPVSNVPSSDGSQGQEASLRGDDIAPNETGLGLIALTMLLLWFKLRA